MCILGWMIWGNILSSLSLPTRRITVCGSSVPSSSVRWQPRSMKIIPSSSLWWRGRRITNWGSMIPSSSLRWPGRRITNWRGMLPSSLRRIPVSGMVPACPLLRWAAPDRIISAAATALSLLPHIWSLIKKITPLKQTKLQRNYEPNLIWL